MRHILLFAAALILPAPLLAQAAAPVAVAAKQADAELAAFFDAFDKASLARSPMMQSYRGIKTDQDKWDDGSDAAAVANHDAGQKALADMRAKFATADLSPASQLSYRLFEKQMLRRDAGFQYRHDGYVFDQMNGAQSEYPAFLINIHGVKTQCLDALQQDLPRADIVLANVILEPLLRIAPRMTAPRLVLSGLLRSQVDECVAAYEQVGYTLRERRDRDGWAAIVLDDAREDAAAMQHRAVW